MPKGIQSGFMEEGIKPTRDTVAGRTILGATETDGRAWRATSGTWAASGGKFTTSTARTSDPKAIVKMPYFDIDYTVNVGYSDAVYIRYADENNWIRITQHQTTSSTSYACNPYACNPVACNPYACNPVACNPYACNPYSCNPYACNPYACNPVACNPYACNPVSCNCTNNYATRPQPFSGRNCYNPNYGALAYSARTCTVCDACCGYFTSCPAGFNQSNYYCAYGEYCTVYTGQTCGTCYSTCYQTCYSTCYQTCTSTCYNTCYQTCYSTCYQTCYSTCYETCYNYYYPVYLRLEKYVAGTLTVVQEVSMGENARMNWIRVTANGTNIQVFSDRSTTTPHINQTVAELSQNQGIGFGKVGYGNQDSGAVLSGVNIKPFGQA